MAKIPGLPVESFWTPGKVISGSIAGLYILASAILRSPADTFEVALICVIPVLMIWMPEIMGRYEGWGVMYGRPITKKTPASLVWLGGWLVLLLPAILLGLMLARL